MPPGLLLDPAPDRYDLMMGLLLSAYGPPLSPVDHQSQSERALQLGPSLVACQACPLESSSLVAAGWSRSVKALQSPMSKTSLKYVFLVYRTLSLG